MIYWRVDAHFCITLLILSILKTKSSNFSTETADPRLGWLGIYESLTHKYCFFFVPGQSLEQGAGGEMGRFLIKMSLKLLFTIVRPDSSEAAF